MNKTKTLVEHFLETGSLLLDPRNPWTLQSGLKSPFYINCRKLLSSPQAMKDVTEALVQKITADIGLDSFDVIAGGVTAGVPFATLLMDRLNKPMCYVRPKPKKHGMGGQIEGCSVKGQRVLLVEDLVTSAGSKLEFIASLRAAGAEVSATLVVCDRSSNEAQAALKWAEVDLYSVLTLEALMDQLESTHQYNLSDVTAMKQYVANPEEWSNAFAA